MQKKTIIGIIVGIVAVAVLVPVVYGVMQRMAVINLKLDYDRMELTDVDFSQTQTIGAAQRIIDQAENPSSQTLQDYQSLRAAVATPETLALDLVANTNLKFTVFLNAHNPSALDAVLDRAKIKISANGHELPNEISISKRIVIPAGKDAVIPIEGITVSGKDVASVLYNFVGDNFVLDTDFAITSYYPTLFEEVPISANINLKMHTIPQKPMLVGFAKPESAYTRQVAYDERDETYQLTFANSNNVPVSGKLQVGILKGNPVCNPACIAPIDNGIATFLRVEGRSLFGIEVRDFGGVHIEPSGQYTANVHNPELRDNAKSAFIARWIPDMDTIPYEVTTEIAGISHSATGEFRTSTLNSARYVVYLLSNDFGYAGSQEFVSPQYKQPAIFSVLDNAESNSGSSAFATSQKQSSNLSLWVYSSSEEKWLNSISATNGQLLTFGGYLKDNSGIGIPNQIIILRESDLLGLSWDTLASGYTNDDGQFTIQWSADAGQADWDGDAEIYVHFDSTSSYSSSDSSWVRVRM